MKRLAWIGLMIVMAICAAGFELDRAARREPALAAIVPGPFRYFAQERLTMATVRSAPPSAALAEATTLMQRSPAPAEHFTFLAIARERNKDRIASGEAIQRAALRGWRDPIAQQAMYDIALAAGDHAEASRRLAALWGLQEDQAPLKAMTSHLIAQPAGRKAMIDTLVAGGNWTKAFMRGALANFTPQMADTISAAMRAGARIDCNTAAGLKRLYLQRADSAGAALLDACTRRNR